MNNTVKLLKEYVKRVMMESIDYTIGPNNLKIITPETLQQIAPDAFSALSNQDGPIWIMTAKPQLLSSDEDGFETWSETNEPELAEFLAAYWDDIAVVVDGTQLVILTGTYDDEYGEFWFNKEKRWDSYMY